MREYILTEPMTIADLARLILKYQDNHPEARPSDYHYNYVAARRLEEETDIGRKGKRRKTRKETKWKGKRPKR